MRAEKRNLLFSFVFFVFYNEWAVHCMSRWGGVAGSPAERQSS